MKENKKQNYILYSTNIKYDNGKEGYMYQLVDAETREENEIGFDQLYFIGQGNQNDPQVLPGKDFQNFDQLNYQEEILSQEEALKIYKELTNENLNWTKLKFDDDIQNNINKDDFAFWYREGVKNKKQALQAQELLKQKGIKADYSKGPFYIDFKGAGVEQRVAHQLLRNVGLTNFVIIHHILKEDDNTTYALYITTVEYDNGENGYMYELIDLDTGEEVGSKIGFKPLYFIGNGDVNDRQALLGKDFNDIKTHGMYQDEVVDKETALYIYNGLLTGDDFYGDKLSFDPRELAPLN